MIKFETYIVVVNYNKKLLLDITLQSLLNDGNNPESIILVDNASTDGSVGFIKEKYPPVKLIEIKKNAGWGKATNIGIRKAMELGGKYVILCNDDIQVHTPNIVTHLIEDLKKYEPSNLYLISPRVHSVDAINEIQNIGGNIIRGKKGSPISKVLKPSKKINKSVRTAECVMGAFLAINLKVFQETDLIDEKMYLYMDETELCYRTWLNGGMCAVDDSLILLHKGATSLGRRSPFQLYYKARNELYFIRKHFNSLEKPYLLLLVLLKMKLISSLKILFLEKNTKYKKTKLAKAQLQGIVHGFLGKMGKVH